MNINETGILQKAFEKRSRVKHLAHFGNTFRNGFAELIHIRFRFEGPIV